MTSSLPRRPCFRLTGNDVIDVIYYLTVAAKVAWLLTGPLMLAWLCLPPASGLLNYVVPLTDRLHKTIYVNKVRVDKDPPAKSNSPDHPRSHDARTQFARFRQLVKSIRSQEIVDVWFSEMEISVDSRRLLAEGDVPVGLVRCLYDALVRCRCRPLHQSPLDSCCSESVLGSWAGKLLWMPLRRRATDAGVPPRCCTWQRLLRPVGWIILASVVPLPYYIRLCVFYAFEDAEMVDRRAAVDRLGLSYGFDHDLFQWLTPTHAVVLAVYVCYALSILCVALLKHVCADVDRLVADTVADLRGVRRCVCVRLLLAHLLLPLEKFGVVVGLLVGLLYWTVMLPVSLMAVACYTLPVIYVTGRLLLHTRCTCLSVLPLTTDKASPGNLSDGVTSFETCCFLDAISGSDETTATARKSASGGCGSVGSAMRSTAVGLVLVALLWSVLLLYAEPIGFGVHAAVMTSVGVVLNFGSDAARRVVLAVWGAVYLVVCYRAALGTYTRYSRDVFATMKQRLADQLTTTAALRPQRRRNTALKYFTADEIRRLSTPEAEDVETATSMSEDPRPSLVTDDSIEYQSKLLHWNIAALSLFVDHRDRIHIPRDLFRRLCRLDVPGSPRSGARVVLTALGRLVGAGLFLLVLELVVELVAEAETSDGSLSIGRTLVTLACGAVPLIVHAAMTRFPASRRHGSELLAGKIEQTVLGYVQSWPVFDLSFQSRSDHQPAASNQSTTSPPQVGDACADQSRPLLSDATELKSVSGDNQRAPAGSRDLSRSHVDLLITIRDDDSPGGGRSGGSRVKSSNIRPTAPDRGSPPGSGNSCFDRHSPGDESSAAPALVTSVSGVAARPSGRPRSVAVDDGNSRARRSKSPKANGIGLVLRKQNSASTIPARNQTRSEEEAFGDRMSSSTLVVDMSGDGDVTAVVGSTRSLPSTNDDDDDDDDVAESQCESTL